MFSWFFGVSKTACFSIFILLLAFGRHNQVQVKGIVDMHTNRMPRYCVKSCRMDFTMAGYCCIGKCNRLTKQNLEREILIKTNVQYI